MAKGIKTGGRNWLPGQTGNPNGSSRVMRERAAIRRLDKKELSEIITKFLRMPLNEFKAINDFELPVVEVYVYKIIKDGMLLSDDGKFDRLMNRTVGKPKDTIDLQGSAIADFTRERIKAMAREYLDEDE